jgi:hypothetical protein
MDRVSEDTGCSCNQATTVSPLMDSVALLLRIPATLVVSANCVWATYYIDDTNTTIRYSPAGMWTPGSNDQDYNGTE